MNRSLGLVATISICCCLASPAPAAVIISEIMYNPQGSDNDSASTNYTFTREWVELYNTGSTVADVSGWQFGDAADNTWATPLPTGTTLRPGQALVVTGDLERFDANWGAGLNRVWVDDFPNLANTIGANEGAALRDGSGVLQDLVRFQDSGWPASNGSDGASIFLVPQALSASDNDLPGNWKPSSLGVYGGRWTNRGGEGENHGSPGYVATEAQTPFAPTPGAVWTMVAFPDTQNYSKSSVNKPIFSQMTTWVRDHREAFNIELLVQEGDIVNQNSQVTPTSGDQTADQQWANARAAMSILDGHVPYIMAAGNHDLGTTSAQNRSTQLNTYFQAAQNPLVDPAQGGVLRGYYEPGRLENAYFELHGPDGRDLLVFSLEFWPRQEVVDWANRIASMAKYANHTAVLLTHSYMNWNEQRTNADPDTYGVGGDSNDGEQLWQELVKLNGNFEMTFSGHVGGDGVGYQKSIGDQGNTVHQMLINTQFETNGGNGWMRIVEFLDDGTTAHVRTYSPFLDLYRTDPANDYYITLSPLPMTPGDFNADGLLNAADLDIWQANVGTSSGGTRITGDANGDGSVDGADYLAWQTAAAAAAATSAAVPEPAGLPLAGAALAVVARRRRGGHCGQRRLPALPQ
ncbi:MAG: lamin tail domain-containing protein [Pirellulales bacterium]|nr:lamin tail domain-containing protein [Pirellulales bacterium]